MGEGMGLIRSKLGVFVALAMWLITGPACGKDATSSSAPTTAITPTASTSPSPTPSPSPTCGPSGTELEIVAKAVAGLPAFDRDCLAAPADAVFTVRFDNQDPDTHNIEILDHPGGTPFFTGDVFTGPKVVTYSVEAIPPGAYYFRCDIHPLRMHGAFLVGAGE
jgi:hypothetical protein